MPKALFPGESVQLFSDPSDEARISIPFWCISNAGIARCIEAMSLIIISYLAPYSLYMKNRFNLDNVNTSVRQRM